MRKQHVEPKQPIVVLGDTYYGFALNHWRNAVMCFLDLVWANKCNFGIQGGYQARENRRRGNGNIVLTIQTTEPLIRYPEECAKISLCFQSQTSTYQATGSADILQFDGDHQVLRGRSVATVGDFESLLARFARNHKLDGVVLPLTDPRYVRVLGLKNERGRLRVGIQSSQ